MITLFTAGYEGRRVEDLIELLRAHGVAQLIDVRERPYSRKPDFNKRRLEAHLAAAGIGYSHIVELGTPKPLRDEVRRLTDALDRVQDAGINAQLPCVDARAMQPVREFRQCTTKPFRCDRRRGK